MLRLPYTAGSGLGNQSRWLLPAVAALVCGLLFSAGWICGRQNPDVAWSDILRRLTAVLLIANLVGHSALASILLTMGSFDGPWEHWRPGSPRRRAWGSGSWPSAATPQSPGDSP